MQNQMQRSQAFLEKDGGVLNVGCFLISGKHLAEHLKQDNTVFALLLSISGNSDSETSPWGVVLVRAQQDHLNWKWLC